MRTELISDCFTSRMPKKVLKKMRKNATTDAVRIPSADQIPTHMMKSGIRANFGMV